MPTPHNSAQKGEIADIVLMPGDPARAAMIAETYLDNVKIVSRVRGNNCYTGTYKGRPVSVMASGMGMPSLGIYTYELFSEYDVKRIIRVGTAGSYVPDLRVKDVFVADSAYSESSFAEVMNGYKDDVTYASKEVCQKLISAAANMGIEAQVGRIHSADVFYRQGDGSYKQDVVENHGCSCVEMESFALFHIAASLGKEAGCVCTISDSFVAPEIMSPEERQNTLHNMIRIALESCLL